MAASPAECDSRRWLKGAKGVVRQKAMPGLPPGRTSLLAVLQLPVPKGSPTA